MTVWNESTFIFISTNMRHEPGGVEERWIAVMAELLACGATVRFLCPMRLDIVQKARAAGVSVDPYILDRWNLLRSRSRLRKYLHRYNPVCVHSTGVEADLLLRAVAKRLPGAHVVSTLACEAQGTRRAGSIDAFMRHFDEWGMKSSDAVFVESDTLADEVRSAGVPAEKIALDPPTTDPAGIKECVTRHLRLYRSYVSLRGRGR